MNTDTRFITHHWGDPSDMDPETCAYVYLNDMLQGMFTLNPIDNEWEVGDDDRKGDIYHFATNNITEFVDFIPEENIVIAFYIEMAMVYHGGASKCTVDIMPVLTEDPKGEKTKDLVEFVTFDNTWDHWPCETEIRKSIKLMCDKFLERFNGIKFNFEIYV